MTALATISRRSQPAPSPVECGPVRARMLTDDGYAAGRTPLDDTTAPNQARTANVGANKAVNVGQMVQLNGSA